MRKEIFVSILLTGCAGMETTPLEIPLEPGECVTNYKPPQAQFIRKDGERYIINCKGGSSSSTSTAGANSTSNGNSTGSGK